MVNIRVKIFGILTDKFKGKREFEVQLPDGATINSVKQKLMEEYEVHIDEISFIAINGEQKKEEYILQELDALLIFPPITGG